MSRRHEQPELPRARTPDHSRSLLRGGAIGIALVALATAGLVAVAAAIAFLAALLV